MSSVTNNIPSSSSDQVQQAAKDLYNIYTCLSHIKDQDYLNKFIGQDFSFGFEDSSRFHWITTDEKILVPAFKRMHEIYPVNELNVIVQLADVCAKKFFNGEGERKEFKVQVDDYIWNDNKGYYNLYYYTNLIQR